MNFNDRIFIAKSFHCFASLSDFPLSMDSSIASSSDAGIPCFYPSQIEKLNLYTPEYVMNLVNNSYNSSQLPLKAGLLNNFSLDIYSIFSI